MSTQPAGDAVSITGLRKHFQSPHGDVVKAVDNIDVTIPRGQIVALLGPNGAGKTTTLDIVLGLTDTTSGRVEVLGLTPRKAIISGKISALLQTGGLLHDMRVGEAVAYIGSTYKTPTLSREVLARAGLEGFENRKIGKLSGGEQQRLKFALALLPNPELLILDEPTTGMDVNARRHFWDTMRNEATEGRTIIFATHYLEEAEQFADRIVLMHKGTVIADGSTATIRNIAGVRHISVRATDVDSVKAHLSENFPDLKFEVRPADADASKILMAYQDSDRVARELLVIPGVSDLEIVLPSLDDAFIHLTTGASNNSVDTDGAIDTEGER